MLGDVFVRRIYNSKLPNRAIVIDNETRNNQEYILLQDLKFKNCSLWIRVDEVIKYYKQTDEGEYVDIHAISIDGKLFCKTVDVGLVEVEPL